MTRIAVTLVDVVVVRRAGEGLEVLLLRRAPSGRQPGSWESVHGHIETDETPAAAAWREVREETGVDEGVLVNLSCVESFYRHDRDEVAVIPVFAFVVAGTGQIRRSAEHDAHDWLPPEAAARRATWPRLAREIGVMLSLLERSRDGWFDRSLLVPRAD